MPDLQVDSALETLLPLMAEQPFLVLTGAGISTSSGIPDYRDSAGVRRGKPPMMIQEFLGSARPGRTQPTRRWPACRHASV